MSKPSKSTLANLLESFFRRHLVAQRGVSAATTGSYRDAFRLFLMFASKQIHKHPDQLRIEEFDRDMVLAFLDHLERERGNSIRSRNCRLAAIHSFFHYAASVDPAVMNLANMVLGIQGKRTTRKILGFIRQPDLEAILATPDRNKPQGRRYYALLLFLARTGARVSEAISVNVGDFIFDWPSQVLLHGKGAKQRIVPLTKDTSSILRELVRERQVLFQPEAPVFVNARGRRLSRFGVIYILRRAVCKTIQSRPIADASSISPHTLRHSLAMGLLQAGVDLTTIQSWLGHASPNTTHQYMEADLEMKRQALKKCNTPETLPVPYRPSNGVMAFLESL